MTATLQDPRQEVQKILHFLGKEVVEGTVARMLHHTSLQEMRKNPAADYETMPTTLMDHSFSPFLWKSGVGQRWRVWDRCPWAVLQSLFMAASILGVSGFAPLIFLPPGITGDWKNGPKQAFRPALPGAHGRLQPQLPDGGVRGSSPFLGGLYFSPLLWRGGRVWTEHPCTNSLFPL